MTDPFDAVLRERISRLLAAVPAQSAPQRRRPLPTSARPGVRRHLVFALGLGLLLLTAIVISLPTLSKPTYQAQLRALGVPEGAEVLAGSADEDHLHQIIYRDLDGQVRCAGQCRGISLIDPSGKVLYDGGPGPKATPTPHR